MPIKVTCQCGAKFNAREQLAGERVECTACGAKMRVPFPSTGMGSGAKGALIGLTTLLTLAVAGGGYGLYAMRGEVDALRTDLGTNAADTEAAIDAEKKRMATVEKDLGVAKANLSSATKEQDRHVVRLDGLDTKIFNAQIDLATTKQRITTLEQTTGSNKSDIASLRTDLTNLDKTLQGYQTQRQQILADIAKAKADITASQAKVTTLESQAKAAIAANNATANDAATGRAALQTNINKVKSRADDLGTEISQLRTTVGSISTGERFQVLTEGRDLIKLDTLTGDVLIYEYAAWGLPGRFVPLDMNEYYRAKLPVPADAKNGTYVMAIAPDLNGNPQWVVRLNTITGQVWDCRYRLFSQWRSWKPWNRTRYPATPPSGSVGFTPRSPNPATDRWELDTHSLGTGMFVPDMLVTAPNGTTYAGIANIRILAPVW